MKNGFYYNEYNSKVRVQANHDVGGSIIKIFVGFWGIWIKYSERNKTYLSMKNQFF